MERLTNSRRSAKHTCDRLHFYEYELMYRSVREDMKRIFGTVFHKMLEAWWLAYQRDEGAMALDCALNRLVITERELDDVTRVQLEALMVGYDARWAPLMGDIEVLHVEHKFELPLVNPRNGVQFVTQGLDRDGNAISCPWVRSGKIDVIICMHGKVYVVEHKTTGSDSKPGSTYWARLRMDPQVSIYVDACEDLGYNIAGCIYDIINKPRIRPLKKVETVRMTQGKRCHHCSGTGKVSGGVRPGGEPWLIKCDQCNGSKWKEAPRPYANQRLEDETLDEYSARLIEVICAKPDDVYTRYELIRLENELNAARLDLWMTAQQIERDREIGAPRNPSACHKYGGTCDFFGVCTGADNLANVHNFKRLTTAHPELTT